MLLTYSYYYTINTTMVQLSELDGELTVTENILLTHPVADISFDTVDTLNNILAGWAIFTGSLGEQRESSCSERSSLGLNVVRKFTPLAGVRQRYSWATDTLVRQYQGCHILSQSWPDWNTMGLFFKCLVNLAYFESLFWITKLVWKCRRIV